MCLWLAKAATERVVVNLSSPPSTPRKQHTQTGGVSRELGGGRQGQRERQATGACQIGASSMCMSGVTTPPGRCPQSYICMHILGRACLPRLIRC